VLLVLLVLPLQVQVLPRRAQVPQALSLRALPLQVRNWFRQPRLPRPSTSDRLP
jgi:hypothetical protein